MDLRGQMSTACRAGHAKHMRGKRYMSKSLMFRHNWGAFRQSGPCFPFRCSDVGEINRVDRSDGASCVPEYEHLLRGIQACV